MRHPRFAEHLAAFIEVVNGGSFSTVASTSLAAAFGHHAPDDALEANLGVVASAVHPSGDPDGGG